MIKETARKVPHMKQIPDRTGVDLSKSLINYKSHLCTEYKNKFIEYLIREKYLSKVEQP